MTGLRGYGGGGGGGGDGRCAECGQAVSMGPCAACESMICVDCGVLSRDPEGQKVICISCARLIADVGGHRRAWARRPRPGRAVIAVIVAVAFVAVALSVLAT